MEFIFIALVIQGLVSGFFCSYIAGEKNRNKVGWFWLGFCFSILAVLALIAVPKYDDAESFGKTPSLLKSNDEDQNKNRIFGKERNLNSSSYQLFLTKLFSIEKNLTLEKYVIQDDVFDTLVDALCEADKRYTSQLSEQEKRALRESRELDEKNALEIFQREKFENKLALENIQKAEIKAKLEPVRRANRKKIFVLAIFIFVGFSFWMRDYLSKEKVEQRLVEEKETLNEKNARIYNRLVGGGDK